jgi:hypothetical protein
MKRVALTRRTPLKRSSALGRSAFGASPMPLLRATPLRRTKLRRKPTRGKAGDEPERLAWLRSLDCCACGRRGLSHAHHRTLSGRGKGQKSPDSEAMPLCARCHSDLHSLAGMFRGLSKLALREWQIRQVEVLQGWYARLFAPREAV